MLTAFTSPAVDIGLTAIDALLSSAMLAYEATSSIIWLTPSIDNYELVALRVRLWANENDLLVVEVRGPAPLKCFRVNDDRGRTIVTVYEPVKS